MATTGNSKSNLKISEEVIAKIVSVAISETHGVTVASKSGDTIMGKFSRKQSPGGVKISMLDSGVVINASICVAYGFNLQEVGKAAQENIAHSVESMTGLKVSAVNVTVSGISFEEEKKPKENK